MRNINSIINDSKSLLASYQKLRKEEEEEINKIQRNGDLTKEAKNRLIQNAKDQFKHDTDRLKARLEENHKEGRSLLQSDTRHLDASRIDDGFYAFSQCLSTPEDFEDFARLNSTSPSKLFYLQNLASQRGFNLNIGLSRADKMKSFDNIHKILEDSLDADSFMVQAGSDTIAQLEQTFQPFDSNDISCSRRDLSLQEAITNDFVKRRSDDIRKAPDTDNAFSEGFGHQIPKTDLTDLETLAGVRAITSQMGNPTAEKRILTGLTDVLNSKQLAERIMPDDVKLCSDFYRRNGDNARADELQRIATLMLADGFAYQNDYGTKTMPDSEGIHNTFNTAVKERRLRQLEAEQRTEGATNG